MRLLLAILCVGILTYCHPVQARDALSISYADWDAVLKQTVMDTGRSDRKPASRVKTAPASRLTKTNPNPTRLEANRVFFHALGEDNKAYIAAIVDSLSRVPDSVPLREFSPNEQLAYWLNLHNATAYSLIADEYPESNLKGFHKDNWHRKVLTVAGKRWSLADIEVYIVNRWQDPRVLYGFYQGTIGGPNLRREAYTAQNVWANLEDNAREFINSLRGIQLWDGGARVSTLYADYAILFPDFDRQLKAHLMRFTDVRMTSLIANLDQFEPEIEDWYIADLYNGHLGLTTSANTNPARIVLATASNPNASPQDIAAIIRKTASSGKYPRHVQEFLTELVERKRHLREAEVQIEELDPGQTQDQ
ncbi:DUF547 domain-containing protein [Kordiimonas lacus]|uniref:DUF547 domain-containing protein n=1 Tax=Kordiimonas lacus TaxID=637679 RepID=A0A1G7E2T7_9PROT|nr:DUF547 domain-containing protein [Kordiimonas lacus]SDE57685.1 Protein of unknown function, DUF547 [Kordiimonas lacus]